MWVAKRTVQYDDGKTFEEYIKSIGIVVTLTGKIEEAKQYLSKAEAYKDIGIAQKGRRNVREYYEVLWH